MSSPPPIDIGELLTPIAGTNPCGESLFYTDTYDAIREARRADDATLGQGDWKRELKVANWREVRKLSRDALATKSKDLQLAAWLTEALIKQEGFAGALWGFRLLNGLVDRFWDLLYPLPEDDDLEFRAQVLESFNNGISAALSELKLTGSGEGKEYSLNEWRESRQVEEKGLKSPQDRDALVNEGKITGEQWDKAVAATRRAFYETLLTDIKADIEEYDKLAFIVDQKFGRQAPSLRDLKRTLEECQSVVEIIVNKKRELEPDATPVETEPVNSVANEPRAEQSDFGANGSATDNGSVIVDGSDICSPTTPVHSATVISIEPQDRADALIRLERIAEFFRRTEPHSPVAYLVQRAVRWGQMPLEEWLNEMISDQSVLSHIRETLGIRNPEQNGS